MYFLIDYRLDQPKVVYASIYKSSVLNRRDEYLKETNKEASALVMITKAIEES